jgi:lactate permease
MAVRAQNYDPTGNAELLTILAALPATLVLGIIVFSQVRIHRAALPILALAEIISVGVFDMPADITVARGIYGGFPLSRGRLEPPCLSI